jgi:putative ABC transport system ATP-binding protein
VSQRILTASEIEVALGGEPILKGASMHLERGEKLAMLGPSGSGKTTLLHVLSGSRIPDSGRVELLGKQVDEMSDSERAKMRRGSLGILAQDLTLLGALSAERNVAISLVVGGLSVPEALGEARKKLDSLGLNDRLHVHARDLSRGQKQRVALARALVGTRTLLMLDEPTTALDASSRDAVLEELDGRVQGGASVLLVTHDPVVAEWADRRLFMREGVLEEMA